MIVFCFDKQKVRREGSIRQEKRKKEKGKTETRKIFNEYTKNYS